MYLKTLAIVLVFLAVIGCQKATPVNTPSSSPQKEVQTAIETFLAHIHAGRADEAFAMTAYSKDIPQWDLDNNKDIIYRFSEGAAQGNWHYTLLDVHVEGIGAVGLMNEDIKEGRSTFDIDPIYLARLDNQWRIILDITKYEHALPLLSPQDYAVYESLEQWYETRKEEVIQTHKSY